MPAPAPAEAPPQPNSAISTRGATAVLVLLSLGHFAVDLYSSAMGVFQPVLVERLGMSLTQAGLLGGLLIFSSSVMQPFYGFLSDRWRTRHFTVLAPAVAGVLLTAIPVAPTYGMVVLLALLGGSGAAMFHPQASALAVAGADDSKARNMAIFVTAGTLGFAAGPSLLSLVLVHAGPERVPWTALVGVAGSVLLYFRLPDNPAALGAGGTTFDWRALKAVWRPLTILYFAVFIRSVVQVTYAQLLPLYLHRERGYTLEGAAHVLSAYLICGSVGGFVGGHLADRFGGRRVIMASMLFSTPFLAGFFLLDGWAAAVSLALGGLILLFTIPVNVVIAQELAPSQAGTVSALMMGFSWGMAGLIFIPLTGWVAEQTSLRTALMALVFFPLIGFVLTKKLPRGL